VKIEDYLIVREYEIKDSGTKLMFKNDPTSFIDPVTISYRGRNRGKGKRTLGHHEIGLVS